MSNDYFAFKQFTVRHDKCAMKVGTDGVLLGSWADGGRRILDIGTGSGLIAMFMAQRFKDAHITAIDIEPQACLQARDNVAAAGMSGRIDVINMPLQDFHDGYFDSIVCNPPFYADTPKSKTAERTIARSTGSLPFNDLFRCASRLLGDNGVFSVVIPAACRPVFDAEAAFAGLWPVKVCAVKTVPRKPVSRYLLAYGKHRTADIVTAEECINDAQGLRSTWYSRLTDDFYIK